MNWNLMSFRWKNISEEIFTEEQIRKIEEIIVKKVKDMLNIAKVNGVSLIKEKYRDWIRF